MKRLNKCDKLTGFFGYSVIVHVLIDLLVFSLLHLIHLVLLL